MVLLALICAVYCSGGVANLGAINPAVPVGAVAPGPFVTAASSQYFERTFNRLVAAPPPLQPVVPVAPPSSSVLVHTAPNVLPAPPQVIPLRPQVIPPQPHVIQAPAHAIPAPPQADPTQPNVAIAVATAHAAAPVATILLPPYPFGPPPIFGFVPSGPPANIPEHKPREQTTPSTTTATEAEVTTTEKETEATTPEPSNSDNNFVQALPSNENINFNKNYGPPLPLAPFPQQRPHRPPLSSLQPFPQQGQLPPQKQPQPTNMLSQRQPLLPNSYQQAWAQKPQKIPNNYWPEKGRPQKLKTSVEVVKVPLAYIAPPPLHKHEHVKVIKHVYGFDPSAKSKIIIHTIRTPGHTVAYRIPISTKNIRPYSIRPKAIKI